MADPIQIESPQANINRARFAGKDFFTFVDDIVARIQLLFVTEFNDFVASGTGQMLIDIVSWAAETLSFYIDRQATESYLATARTRRAVNRLARQIGYKMRAAVASSTDLEITLAETHSFDVPIEERFQFQGPGQLVFEAVESITFSSGEGPDSTPRVLSVREGITRVETFTSNGNKNQVFRLNPGENRYVADGTVVVTVDGVEWSQSIIITFDQTDQYEVSENASPPTVRFGDGVAGNIPPSGADIRVEYLATSGRAGRVTSGTIQDVVSPLVVSFEQISINVNNPEPSSAGDDPESLESAKANAPAFFKTRQVAVTRQDYESLATSFTDAIAGAVAVAQAFVARGAGDDLTLQILLSNIRDVTHPLESNINAETEDTRENLNTIDSQTGDAQDFVSNDIQPNLDTIVTSPLTSTASGSIVNIRQTIQGMRATVNDADVRADEGIAADTLANKDSALSDIKTSLANVESQINGLISETGTIEQAVFDANAGVTTLSPALASILTASSSARVNQDDIDSLVGADFVTAIENELQGIFDHVDGFLANDCKANLVQVPVLTRDVDGFLVEPSIALERSLESYLEARKEVTQVVEVVSGGPFLVAAVIEGTVGISEGYVQQTVLSNVRKAIDDLLRVRSFGRSLRLSDIYGVVVPNQNTGQKGVDGVAYATLSITGPSENLDSGGNLIVSQKEVVTKGSVTIAGETATS